jgi:hypothetical protein
VSAAGKPLQLEDMTISDRQVKLAIEPLDGVLLQELKEFRRRLWKEQVGGDLSKVPSFLIEDAFDHAAIHFLARYQGEIIGAARLSVETDACALRTHPMYKDVTGILPSPIGVLARLIVDAPFRACGLGVKLETERIIYASILGCKTIVAGVPAHRLEGFKKRGFEVLFATNAGFQQSSLPPPTVIYRNIEAGVPGACLKARGESREPGT